MKKKKLQYGETPFHKMNPDQLLKAAIRMYDACVSAKCALALAGLAQSENPFWIHGTGGRALEKCSQVVSPLEKIYGSESIYRSFYRESQDLLWKDNPPIILTRQWAICPICGNSVATGLPEEQKTAIGQRCSEAMPWSKDCQGILRAKMWEDMGMKTQ